MVEKGPLTRSPADLIESYLDFTSETSSPEIFRLWSGISLVAGVLERRTYIVSRGSQVFPSLYVLLVATPGIGKTQAIVPVKRLWRELPFLKVAPDNMTKAALIDTLEEAKRTIVVSPTQILEFSMLNVAADELGVFITKYDDEFLSVMNKVFDSPNEFVEARRMRKGDNLTIVQPQLNLLAGTQPAFLGSVFPDHAWHSGFASRLLMIFSAQRIRGDLFNGFNLDPGLRKRLLNDLTVTLDLWGEYKWTPVARDLISHWYMNQDDTAPTHSKLRDYIPRRILYMFKLCMISAASRGTSLLIEEYDFHRAWTWLRAAELAMPDVFRAIQQKSDGELILDLHRYLWIDYAKTKQPVPVTVLYRFLSTQVPAERIRPIIETAERTNHLIRSAGTELYRPAPMDKIHLE